MSVTTVRPGPFDPLPVEIDREHHDREVDELAVTPEQSMVDPDRVSIIHTLEPGTLGAVVTIGRAVLAAILVVETADISS